MLLILEYYIAVAPETSTIFQYEAWNIYFTRTQFLYGMKDLTESYRILVELLNMLKTNNNIASLFLAISAVQLPFSLSCGNPSSAVESVQTGLNFQFNAPNNLNMQFPKTVKYRNICTPTVTVQK